jgi:hypothetical protein
VGPRAVLNASGFIELLIFQECVSHVWCGIVDSNLVCRTYLFMLCYVVYEGVSKSFRTESITKYPLRTTFVAKQHKWSWRQNLLDWLTK